MSGHGDSDVDEGTSTEVNPVFALVAAPMLKTVKLPDRLLHLDAFELYEKQVKAQIGAGAKIKPTAFKETISLRDLETICLFELGVDSKDVTSEDLFGHFEGMRKLEEESLFSVDIGKILSNVKMDPTEDIATRVSTFFGEINACLKDNRCLDLVKYKTSMKELTKEIIKKLEPGRLRNAAQKSYDFKADKPKTLPELMRMIQEVALVIEKAYKLGLSVTKDVSGDRMEKRESFKSKSTGKPMNFSQKKVSVLQKPATYSTTVATAQKVIQTPNNKGNNKPVSSPKKEGVRICYRCGKSGHISTECKASDAEAEAYQANRRFTRSMAGSKGMSAAITESDSFILNGLLNNAVTVSVKPDTGSTRSYAGRVILEKLKAAGCLGNLEKIKEESVLLADEKAEVRILAKSYVDLEMYSAGGPLIVKAIPLYFLDTDSVYILLGNQELKRVGVDMESLLAAAAKEQDGRRSRAYST